MREILAIDPTIKNNAQLIREAALLGYVNGDVLDATYGEGRFWACFDGTDMPQGVSVTANDINPLLATCNYDWTKREGDPLAFPSEWNDRFDTVVFDPPYKLNGTSTGRGPSTSDASYGVGGPYTSVNEKMTAINRGVTECLRVTKPGGHLLVKCQDQVVSGKVVWQTREIADWAEWCGATHVDALHLLGHRKQPAGRRQLHARRNYSTLLIFQRDKR